ncbi:MAG TPA: Crp/Fnr family transcriptional regulator [Mycoplana sp.]|nr:Crp/Fnr family transcriptional regulator [Mycoplana sp.]
MSLTVNTTPGKWQTPCTKCPLRALGQFREFSAQELEFVSHFKVGELSVERGAAVLVEGAHSVHIYTVLNGIGFRYKLLEDGRRQIMNYVFPGDLLGLQGVLLGEMEHSVEALGPLTLCVFERSKLARLFENHVSLAYDLTWIAAREERVLDEHLLSIGRRSALERTAYLLSYIHLRAEAVGAISGAKRVIPVTQLHLADTLGLSLVHTNKTLRKLAERRLIRWQDGGYEVLDAPALLQLSNWEGLKETARPFI